VKQPLTKEHDMIRTKDNEPQPMDAQDRLGRHPLGIAALVLRAVGTALMSGGLFLFALTIAFCLAKNASAFQTAIIAGGVVFGGAMLVHQATGLARQAIDAEARRPLLRSTEPAGRA
jgi:hypothetical protein